MPLDRTLLIAAFLFTVAAGVLPLASYGTALARSAGAPAWIEAPFRLACHGIDSRSLHVAGTPMPICARCFAIYMGALAGILVFLAVPPLRLQLPALVLLFAVIPMGIDGLTQAAGLRESTNTLRVGTGSLAGAVFMLWALGNIARAPAVIPGESIEPAR